MKFEKIEIDPQKNPAILDTATWEAASAWDTVSAVDESYWNSVLQAVREGHPLPGDKRCVVYVGSCAEYRAGKFFLAGLVDGQQVFIQLGTDSKDTILGEPIGSRSLENGTHLAVYRTDAATIDCYVTLIKPDRSPKALGSVPRLGVGSRMSTAAWPGVWQAMNKCNFQANPIQNSVREVNLLQDILACWPPRFNYLANFGRVEEGHTGSTFEGLWVAGVLEALKVPSSPVFGADADHITVRRSADDIIRAKRIIEAARRYTFFTLDVSDILNYEAMNINLETTAQEFLANHICQPNLRKEVVAYHCQSLITGQQYKLDKATIGRLVGKYWPALNAVEELSNHIRAVRNEVSFDLELSIDETPSGVDAFTCLTTESELMFLMLELKRRGVPITHIAPNFGVEKGSDYRGQDGLVALEKRIRGLYEIACEFGIMLDCHSGDDLKPATRRAIGRAAQGNIHFKISPFSQVIFAETMKDVKPERFRFWWDDTFDYARREAAAGSDFAAQCLDRYEAGDNRERSPDHAVFHYYSFATVGKRNQKGQFIHREKFYNLSTDFYREYQNRICSYLCEAAADVFNLT
ncbi:MAG: tagaturonate epimerase family protein [Planctomycetota bacterium]